MSASKLAIDVSNTQRHLKIDADALVRTARAVLEAQGIDQAAISIAVVDNAAIHRLNRLYLQHDWPTDVVTFPLSEPDEPILTGEIVISAEMAIDTASPACADPALELTLYLVHGLLHLCGHDDLSDEDRARMRERETAVLRVIGLPNAFDLPPAAARSAQKGVKPCSG